LNRDSAVPNIRSLSASLEKWNVIHRTPQLVEIWLTTGDRRKIAPLGPSQIRRLVLFDRTASPPTLTNVRRRLGNRALWEDDLRL
jgi:hypothetical protein